MREYNRQEPSSLEEWIQSWYRKHLNPEMVWVHTYISLGILVFLIASLLLPSSSRSGILQGIIVATAIFCLHEYTKQKLNAVFDLIFTDSDHALTDFPKLNRISLISVDFLIAVPMFGYAEYTNIIGTFLVLFWLYTLMARLLLRTERDAIDFLTNNSNRDLYLIAWGVAFTLSLTYLLLNYSETVLFIQSLLSEGQPSNHIMTLSPLRTILFLVSILIVDLTLLIILLLTIMPLFVVAILLLILVFIPYSLVDASQQSALTEMPELLRYWAVASIFVIYLLGILPRLPYAVDRAQESIFWQILKNI